MTVGRRRKDKKKMFFRCAAVAVMVVAAACGSYGIYYYHGLHQKEDQFDMLRQLEGAGVPELTVEDETEKEIETEAAEEIIVVEPLYDFDELCETNSDIYAWLTVPGTDVDYPVLQSEEDNYYLSHNLDHSEGYPGCIYTNQINERDFTDLLTVLYGHDMRSTGTMFHSLHLFEDATFFEENREIIVYTREQRLTYTVCAASSFSDIYIPAFYDVAEPEARAAFLKELSAVAQGDAASHTRKIEKEYVGEPLIILSTCIKGQDENRYLVVGVLTETASYVSSH